MGKFVPLQMCELGLLLQECVGFVFAGGAQRQRYGSRVNAST
jgi:hypothetical protein